MRTVTSTPHTYSGSLIGLVLTLFISQSLCLPGASYLGDSTILSGYGLSRTRREVPLKSDLKPSQSQQQSSPSPQTIMLRFGLLIAKSNTTTEEPYCIVHYNGKSIPWDRRSTNFYDLVPFNVNLCSSNIQTLPSTEAYVLVSFNNKCPLNNQALAAQVLFPKSKGLIVSVPDDLNVYRVPVYSNTSLSSFIVALISQRSVGAITSSPQNVKALVYEPDDKGDDLEIGLFSSSLIGIWFVAMLTVAIGSYMSGLRRYKLFLGREQTQITADKPETNSSGSQPTNDPEARNKANIKMEDASLDVTPLTVILFVTYMCSTLLILYFFYSYLVFIMIIFFVVFCTLAIYSLITNIEFVNRWVDHHLTSKPRKFVWHLSISLLSSILPIIWFVYRQTPKAWALQNVLGSLFCIHVLQMLRFPNYRIIGLLLSLLFLYDIFFVFLTPFLTSDGESIMVKVATGGSGDSEMSFTFGEQKLSESLPVVFQWPRFLIKSTLPDLCYSGKIILTSKLGFGDVLVPGFLTSYCSALDNFLNVPYKLYYLTSCISYGLGLFITFIALQLMNSAQPALLYLVPATLFPPLLVAWRRNEISILWRGPEEISLETLKSSESQGQNAALNENSPTND